MRFRKVLRGFTTNSSASSEWIPPPNGAEGQTAPPPPIPTTASMGFKVGAVTGFVVLALIVERFFDYKRKQKAKKEANSAQSDT